MILSDSARHFPIHFRPNLVFPVAMFSHRFVAAFFIFANVLAGRAAESRPNILYCLADDWAWPHAGAYGDRVIHTPTFDRVAREGMLFNYCFSAAPSCTPSRAAMLTGQYPHRLEEGSCLWGFCQRRFPCIRTCWKSPVMPWAQLAKVGARAISKRAATHEIL